MNNEPAKLLLGTGNAHKAGEIEAMLRQRLPGLGLRILTAGDFPDLAEPEETGATFSENAIIKAHHYALSTGLLALADDSGLVVDALDGRPGLRSARYAETDEGRVARVLEELRGVERERRTAHFMCVAALADPAGRAITREGKIEGWIVGEPRGVGGFGYDPIFEPNEDGGREEKTLAEISAAEKNAISHRGRAIEAIAPLIRRALRGEALAEIAGSG